MSEFKHLLSVCREVKELVDDDWREAIEEMLNEADDFEYSGYRFIHKQAIDRIQQEELESDPHILGCFNASFLAEILGTSTQAIEAIQEAEAYEGLGEMIISGGHIEELQEDYAAADGYGHYFAHYDGCTNELHLGKLMYPDYYYFKVN